MDHQNNNKRLKVFVQPFNEKLLLIVDEQTPIKNVWHQIKDELSRYSTYTHLLQYCRLQLEIRLDDTDFVFQEQSQRRISDLIRDCGGDNSSTRDNIIVVKFIEHTKLNYEDQSCLMQACTISMADVCRILLETQEQKQEFLAEDEGEDDGDMAVRQPQHPLAQFNKPTKPPITTRSLQRFENTVQQNFNNDNQDEFKQQNDKQLAPIKAAKRRYRGKRRTKPKKKQKKVKEETTNQNQNTKRIRQTKPEPEQKSNKLDYQRVQLADYLILNDNAYKPIAKPIVISKPSEQELAKPHQRATLNLNGTNFETAPDIMQSPVNLKPPLTSNKKTKKMTNASGPENELPSNEPNLAGNGNSISNAERTAPPNNESANQLEALRSSLEVKVIEPEIIKEEVFLSDPGNAEEYVVNNEPNEDSDDKLLDLTKPALIKFNISGDKTRDEIDISTMTIPTERTKEDDEIDTQIKKVIHMLDNHDSNSDAAIASLSSDDEQPKMQNATTASIDDHVNDILLESYTSLVVENEKLLKSKKRRAGSVKYVELTRLETSMKKLFQEYYELEFSFYKLDYVCFKQFVEIHFNHSELFKCRIFYCYKNLIDNKKDVDMELSLQRLQNELQAYPRKFRLKVNFKKSQLYLCDPVDYYVELQSKKAKQAMNILLDVDFSKQSTIKISNDLKIKLGITPTKKIRKNNASAIQCAMVELSQSLVIHKMTELDVRTQIKLMRGKDSNIDTIVNFNNNAKNSSKNIISYTNVKKKGNEYDQIADELYLNEINGKYLLTMQWSDWSEILNADKQSSAEDPQLMYDQQLLIEPIVQAFHYPFSVCEQLWNIAYMLWHPHEKSRYRPIKPGNTSIFDIAPIRTKLSLCIDYAAFPMDRPLLHRLIKSISTNDLDTLLYLHGHNNLNLQSLNNGYTCLHIAAWDRLLESLEVLIERGGDVSVYNDQRETVLDAAQRQMSRMDMKRWYREVKQRQTHQGGGYTNDYQNNYHGGHQRGDYYDRNNYSGDYHYNN